MLALQIIWQQAIYMTVLFGKLMQAIFFGDLRMIEREASRRTGPVALRYQLADLVAYPSSTATTRAWLVRRHRDVAGSHHLQGRVRIVVRAPLRQLALPQGIPLASLGPCGDGAYRLVSHHS